MNEHTKEAEYFARQWAGSVDNDAQNAVMSALGQVASLYAFRLAVDGREDRDRLVELLILTWRTSVEGALLPKIVEAREMADTTLGRMLGASTVDLDEAERKIRATIDDTEAMIRAIMDDPMFAPPDTRGA